MTDKPKIHVLSEVSLVVEVGDKDWGTLDDPRMTATIDAIEEVIGAVRHYMKQQIKLELHQRGLHLPSLNVKDVT